MIKAISIFDVDRTLTRRPTYSAFLLYGALRSAPWRLALLPVLIPVGIAYAAKRIPRKRMKEAMHRFALGGRMNRAQAMRIAEGFAASLIDRGVYRQAFSTIDAERREGRLIVLATAAPELYIAPFAKLLGADVVLATRSGWDDGWLIPTIDGENCYGAEKLNMICEWLRAQNMNRDHLHIRFFSDHASDLPTFEWVNEPVMVNPSSKLRVIGTSRGWRLIDWTISEPG